MYSEIAKFEKLEQMKDLQIINLGTGMGYYDFCYENINMNAFNFSLPQQSLVFDYKLLVNYYHKFAYGCKVCLVLPYFIFCAHDLPEIRHIYERYYSILPENEVKAYCKITYEEYKNKINKHIKAKKLELCKPLTALEMEQQSNGALLNWKRELGIVSFSSGELSESIKNEIKITKNYLEKILDFCKSKNFIPVIIVPPMSQVLLDKISYDFRKTHFYDNLDVAINKNIYILDYTADKKFCDPQLYGWPGFLIKDAAKMFTEDVVLKIRDL